MHETEHRNDPGSDPLAEIIRAAGPRSAPPQQHYDDVYVAARRAWQGKVRSRRNSRWYALAASVAVIGIGGLLTYWLQTADNQPVAILAIAGGTVEVFSDETETWSGITGRGIDIASGARIRTGSDGLIALDLADGGSLRLNNNTEIVAGVQDFELLDGTLYFDSAGRMQSMSLDIRTPFGSVRDIGTQYEVNISDDLLRIRVREGEVALLRSSAVAGLVGEAGDQIQLSARGQIVRQSIAPDDPAWSWVEALAQAPESSAQSILSYLRWIGRETGKRLVFEPESVELQAELATFGGDPEGLTPLMLLESIAATSDFNFRVSEDGAIVIGRN